MHSSNKIYSCATMFITAALINIICTVHGADLYFSRIEQKINNLSKAKNVSDDKLVMGETYTFVNDNGFRREGEVLRVPPAYFHPSERNLNLKALDMMRQALYATQGRMTSLESILARYKDDPSLRMAFIYNRLKQLIIDLRRIYTLALKWRLKKRTFEQVVWYAHCTRKYIDVFYIVQYVIDTHTAFARLLKGDDDMPKMPGFQ